MAKKNAGAFPHLDYSNINIFVEEAIRIENHRPAIVVVWTQEKIGNYVRVDAVMRIIPSTKWENPRLLKRIQSQLSGLLSHETLHMWLGIHLGEQATMGLDKLPKPANMREYMSGVFGWNLGGDKTSK